MGEQKAEPWDDSTTLWQRFAVEFAFPVCFTRALFAPENPLLRDTLVRPEPSRRHRLLAFVDDGALAVLPGLVERIKAYTAAYPAQLELLGEPFVVPGGEAIKSELHFVERMQRVLFERHVDSPFPTSWRSVAVPCSTRSAWSPRPPTAVSGTCACRPRYSLRTIPAWGSRTA